MQQKALVVGIGDDIKAPEPMVVTKSSQVPKRYIFDVLGKFYPSQFKVRSCLLSGVVVAAGLQLTNIWLPRKRTCMR